MNLSENQKILSDLKQILQYYDYLEYDESCSKGVNQLCIKVSDLITHCSLRVIETICVQLGTEYKYEPEKSTKFYIRMMNDDDYALVQNEPEKESLAAEHDSAIAYYYRGLAKFHMGQYESAIEDYDKACNLKPDLNFDLFVPRIGAEKVIERSDRERFYWTYHNKFLEREAKRAEVLKRHGTSEWQKKQAEVLERDGWLCVCGDKAKEIHHKTYENIGQKPLSDLVALCRYCYRGIHSGEKIKLWKGSNPISNKEYREKYLELPAWKQVRQKVLERDSYLCICGERATYVHHKTYENLGQELLSDLVALCKNCHDGYHGSLFARSDSFWHMRT